MYFFVNHKLDASAVILAFSTLIAPLAALQIQVYIEGLKAKNVRKLDIFRTLMATRASQLDHEHVKALNMINIEFFHDTEVINAWKQLLEIENNWSGSLPEDFLKANDNALANLLQKIAAVIGLNFYDDEIRKGCYRPGAHVTFENTQTDILNNLNRALQQGKLQVSISSETVLQNDAS